jgi:uncharacterized membrane-anchored protein YhcB (DUF1043 family)
MSPGTFWGMVLLMFVVGIAISFLVPVFIDMLVP